MNQDDNSQLIRRSMTGMSDEQLTMVGYVSVVWNALERNLEACIWAAAGWSEDVGELVTVGLGNVSKCELLMNLIRRPPDKQIAEEDPNRGEAKIEKQANGTLALYDLLRGARNDLMHGFFNFKKQGWPRNPKLTKYSTKARTGAAEMKLIEVSLSELIQLARDLGVCDESFNDLYHKLLFRKKFLDGERGMFAHNYDDAVHGWRAPSFDTALVQEAVTRRSQRLNPPQGRPQPPPSPP